MPNATQPREIPLPIEEGGTDATDAATARTNLGVTSQADHDAHVADTNNPHAVTAAQAGADPAGSAATVQSNLDAHEADDVRHSLEQDASPRLGADLRTYGKAILITDNGDVLVGALGLSSGELFIARLTEEGDYDPNEGGIVFASGGVALYGGAALVDSLSNPDGENKQVYVNDSGILYTVAPPAPGWEVTDTDIGDYDLGTGTGTGAWVQMTGLEITIPEDVADGDRVNVTANVQVANKSGNRAGSISIGFGVNDVAPADGQVFAIPSGFDGYVVVALSTTTHGGLTAGDNIDMFARRESGEHNSFGVDLLGSIQPHEMTVSVPSEGGATVDAVTVNRADHGVGDLKAAVVSALPGTPDADTLYFVTG